MNRYTIYCTAEQTKKALELGAPITIFSDTGNIPDDTAKKWNLCTLGSKTYVIPTAEQLIGWLEEQGIMFNICTNPFDEFKTIISKAGGYNIIANIKWNKRRKGATLAAIDAALEYLTNNKK